MRERNVSQLILIVLSVLFQEYKQNCKADILRKQRLTLRDTAKVSSRSYVSLQHYRWRSFAYFTFTVLGLVPLYRGKNLFRLTSDFNEWGAEKTLVLVSFLGGKIGGGGCNPPASPSLSNHSEACDHQMKIIK